MKAYLPTLLLFFFLVDKSVSPPTSFGKLLNNRLVKELGRQIAKEAAKEIVQNWLDDFKNHSAPPTPTPPGAPAPLEEIPGLILVKEYLSNYGYIQFSDNFTDNLDEETRSALKSYQHFFNLTENRLPRQRDSSANDISTMCCPRHECHIQTLRKQ